MRLKGFTLLEVMLALAVFAFAMTALVGFNARGYVNEARARRLSSAVELARTKMVEYQLEIEKGTAKGEFPEEKTEEGAFEKPFEDYRWKVEVRKVELPMPPISEEEGGGGVQQMMQMMTKQISDAVREIKLTVQWNEMDKERSFSVTTHIAKL
ncbi:MAG: type II secretion system protein [Deltaproteobacteria bacterium]|nr:type II secretion system protein [Deltaproteobacteria bacterium]MBI2342326.1 type II secretion system protein [Deltaproteobacteria bacterium]MBI2974991.1 type II secretion system protein [Deltaproteobacteria bacterium]